MEIDLISACEHLANLISPNEEVCVSLSDIQKWQTLFGLGPDEAETEIQMWRADLGREPLSSSAWELLEPNYPAHNKETYEYALATGQIHQQQDALYAKAELDPKSRYLLKLEGPLHDAATVQSIGNLQTLPATQRDESGGTGFCIVDAAALMNVLRGLRSLGSNMRPTFVRISMADKDLSSYSRYPTLGIDTILPQFRADRSDSLPLAPTQEEYPVWYFFYGTLTDPDVLSRVLDRSVTIEELHPAVIRGGKLETWAGKYRAMIHSDHTATVQACAFLVESQEDEDALRFWETDKYEVVRCKIEFQNIRTPYGPTTRDGLTFLFVGR